MAEKMELKQSFLYTFLLGLAAHGYCFLNLMVSHDSLNDFYVYDQWERANFGRIFYSIYISLTRGRIVLPWLIGVLALCWISIAVYFVAKMFHIQKSGLILLISGIFVTNPTVYALAATYIHDLDADMFAMMLSVISVYLWVSAIREVNTKKKYSWLILGGTVLSVALGIYQSYISLAITLIIIWSIKELLENKKFKEVMIDGCLGIGMLIVAAVFYLIELKVFELLTGVSTMSSETYNGLGNLSAVFDGNIVENILNTYFNFIDAFKNAVLISYPESISLIILGILAILIVGIAAKGLIKIEWKSKILFMVLSVLLPFGMNITYFLSNGQVHVLTQYALWMFYLLALVLISWIKEEAVSPFIKKAAFILMVGCISLTIAENIQTSNSIYVKKDLEYQATLSYMTRVVDRIEEQEEYIPGETPVLIIGENVNGITKYGFERYERITGVSSNRSVTYYDTYEDYFEYVLGTSINLCENSELQQDSRVIEMPAFPKQGSVKMIDGILVVKLADE